MMTVWPGRQLPQESFHSTTDAAITGIFFIDQRVSKQRPVTPVGTRGALCGYFQARCGRIAVVWGFTSGAVSVGVYIHTTMTVC